MKMNNVIFQYKHYYYYILHFSLLLLLSYQHQSTFSFISTLILSRETFLPLHSNVRSYFNGNILYKMCTFQPPVYCHFEFFTVYLHFILDTHSHYLFPYFPRYLSLGNFCQRGTTPGSRQIKESTNKRTIGI